MILTSETLLDTTVYGTPSGNYDGSSQDFHGNAVIAANYYAGLGAIQTATITVSDFVGIITLQATLNDQVESAMWFDVGTYGNGIDPYTEVAPITATGNFTYMRARITGFDSGTIDSITLVY